MSREEKAIMEKYSDVNNLVRDMDNLDLNHIHHIKEDIDFHLGRLLEMIDPKNLKVVVLDTIAEDMKRHYDIDVKKHHNKNPDNKKYLTDENRAKVKEYVAKDYACIQKIYDMGLISREQYDILMK